MGLGRPGLGAAFRHLRRLSDVPTSPSKGSGGRRIKRLVYSLAGVALLGVAGAFTYQALAGSLVYFILPSEYAAEPDIEVVGEAHAEVMDAFLKRPQGPDRFAVGRWREALVVTAEAAERVNNFETVGLDI